MLSTKDVKFAYNRSTTFQFPDLYCPAGDTLLITGASGRGKTTLLHLMAGLLIPSSGQIEIDSVNLAHLSDRQLDRFRGNKIGIVFQQSHFVHSLNIGENILLAARLAGVSNGPQQFTHLMQQLNLTTHTRKKPARLSQGQQQRASIARAVITQPAVILADEPTSSLDDDHCQSVATLLQTQAMQTGAALIIVTHDQRLKDIFKRNIALP